MTTCKQIGNSDFSQNLDIEQGFLFQLVKFLPRRLLNKDGSDLLGCIFTGLPDNPTSKNKVKVKKVGSKFFTYRTILYCILVMTI